MSRYRDQVAAALAAVTMHGGDRYSWLGRPSRPLAPALNAALDDAQRAEHLRSSLAEELYWSFYCHGRPVPARWGEPEPVAPDPWLAAELAAADRGRGGASPGWTVRRVAGDEALVATARLRARVPRADCTAVTGAVVPGAPVSVSHPGRLAAESPGFVTFLGEAGREHTGPHGVVRAYWNITLASAAPLVAALTGRLNAERVPFRLKVVDHPFRLDRRDAAVLYLPGAALPPLRGALVELAERLSPGLLSGVPAFTLPAGPGLGLAEDAGDGGQSFGARRCALLAAGIVTARDMPTVAAQFAAAGVAIDAPYLEPSLTGRHVL